jgi:hypothetical protein
VNLKNLKFGLGLIAALGATCVIAAAQEKQKPKFVIRDCVTYLRLLELQHRNIETETFMLGTLKDARTKQGAPASSGPTPDNQTRQAPSTTAAIDYDIEIGKLAFTIEKDRRVLSAIERRYKECLQAPPWRVAKAVPTSPPTEAKKPATKRATARSSERAPRPAAETQGSGPPRGGIGIGIGGGGVGIGF